MSLEEDDGGCRAHSALPTGREGSVRPLPWLAAPALGPQAGLVRGGCGQEGRTPHHPGEGAVTLDPDGDLGDR